MRHTKVRQNPVQAFTTTRIETITTISSDVILAWCPTVDTTYKIDGAGASAPITAGTIRGLDLSIGAHVLDTPVICEIMDDIG